MPFKSDAQRRAAFANMNKGYMSRSRDVNNDEVITGERAEIALQNNLYLREPPKIPLKRNIYEVYNGRIIRKMPESEIMLKHKGDKYGLVHVKRDTHDYWYKVVRLDNWYSGNRKLWAVDNGVI